ncbi:type III secretion systems effector SseF [Salmonella enterica]|uniref:Type III secretion systems effector SseF n=1 Tax=Salmonella enterica TaxID=28901 RepID=A0A701YWZ5_SALER|nr:type III secretion systems effector SseF [Salmonella enterica]HAC6565929.1 type III secretion systems effector SseF [Salmonella enterica subsp. indica]HBC0161473.1 type III secretion systems effector SseF [Salmonella enterica subsp. indica]HCM1933344.1 type III secretion systems effector SseF [Salmonella enterica subsp. indica serovar 6,7:z41:1,7]
MEIHISPAASNIVDGNSPPSDIQAKEASFPPPEIPAPGTPTPPVLLTPEQIKQQRDYALHFMQYTIRALGATVVFGLSVAAAVISGGAALPIVILAGAALVIAIGDACCAYHNYQLICQQKEPLKTSSDSVALVVSALALKCGASLNCANTLANSLSLLIRSGIAISFLVISLQLPLPAAESIVVSLDMGSVSTSVSLTAIGAVLDYCLARPPSDAQENAFDKPQADPSVLLAEKITEICKSATSPPLMDNSDPEYRGEP